MPASHLKTGWYYDFKHFDFLGDPSQHFGALDHSLFFSSHWFDCVLHWLPPHSKPIFWVYTERNKLIGIVPLLMTKTVSRKLTVNQLEWLRVPDSHFCGILAQPDNYPKILQALWHALAKAPFPWHTLKLYPVMHSLGEALQKSCPFSNSLDKVSVHPWIDINSSWDEYYKTRSRRLKKGNNHLKNRLLEKGQIEIKHVTHQTSHLNQERIIHLLKPISQGSWKSKTKTTFDNQGPLQFIKHLTTAALEKHWLSLWLLYLDDTLLAYEYQLQEKNSVYALRADFNEAYRSYSPGSYLNWCVLESLFNQGVKRYFMGPGNNAYKERWQNACLPVYSFCAYSNTFKGKLLNSLDAHIIPKLRPLKHKFSNSQKKVPEV